VLRATRVPDALWKALTALVLMSSTTRLTSCTSLVIRVEMRARTSCGTRDQSAVIASSDDTGRSTTGARTFAPRPGQRGPDFRDRHARATGVVESASPPGQEGPEHPLHLALMWSASRFADRACGPAGAGPGPVWVAVLISGPTEDLEPRASLAPPNRRSDAGDAFGRASALIPA